MGVNERVFWGFGRGEVLEVNCIYTLVSALSNLSYIKTGEIFGKTLIFLTFQRRQSETVRCREALNRRVT